MLHVSIRSIACVHSTPMDTREQEARALKELFDTNTALGQAAFGKANAIGGGPMVWQYLSGHRPLNLAAAIKFASGLRVQIDAFSPRLAAEANAAYQLTAMAHLQPRHRSSSVTAMQQAPEMRRPADAASVLSDMGKLLATAPPANRRALQHALADWAEDGGGAAGMQTVLALLEPGKRRIA